MVLTLISGAYDFGPSRDCPAVLDPGSCEPDSSSWREGGWRSSPVTTPRSLVWPNTTATTLLYLIIRYIFFITIIFSFQCTLRSCICIFCPFCQAYYFKRFLFPFSFVEKGEEKFCRPSAGQPLRVGALKSNNHHYSC